MLGNLIYSISDFKGGISEDRYKGIRGSFQFGYGLDIHSSNDVLRCQQKLKKDSGTTVTELILFFLATSNGRFLAFGDAGGIYEKISGTWTKVYTDGNGRISGAEEYNDYIYWATATNLSRIAIGGTFPGNVQHNWKTLESAEWHTMKPIAALLMICNNDWIATVNSQSTFQNHHLALMKGNFSKCLEETDIYAAIGSTKGDKVDQGAIWLWNKNEDSYDLKKPFYDKGVNAMIMGTAIIIQVGKEGALKYFDGVNQVSITRFPTGGWTNPGAIANERGLPLFGVYGSDRCGVYSYGRVNKNDYADALNLEYLISSNKMSGIEIGALGKYEGDLYVSWKDGTNYGIDIRDANNKATGVYQGLIFDAGRSWQDKMFGQVIISTRPLPKNCSVEVEYQINEKGGFKKAKMEDGSEKFQVEDGTEAIFEINEQGRKIEIKVILNPAGNDTPEVDSIITFFNLI